MPRFATLITLACLLALTGCGPSPEYDLVIRNGAVYDGGGGPPLTGDVAIRGDRIAATGALAGARGRIEIDARGLAVAPGFVNMLSWATESLLADGRSQSDIRQGVTLEVFGEGTSMGPLNDAMKKEMLQAQTHIRYPLEWTTLGEYLAHLEKRGVSPNVASFVGATTVRIHELGYADRPPTVAELDRMRALVRQAMEEGALGVGSSLIYPPAFYARTDELVALCQEAARYNGMYISHIRSEGDRLIEALDEFFAIARRANIPAELYHLKAAGRRNWPKLEEAIRKIEAARAEGLRITADMYTYTAASTGLDAVLPPWAQEGGTRAFLARLRNPATRRRLMREMRAKAAGWENMLQAAGSPDRVLLTSFKNPAQRELIGKNLAEVAAMRHKSAEETAMDLLLENDGQVGAVYFMMSEDNVKRQIALPWVSFGSDAESGGTGGVFLNYSVHPRAYGTFARLLGKYVRDEKVITLQEAVRRLTSLPAENLKLEGRGRLKEGYYADVVVFDPARIQDHATFREPRQYATGVVHVMVNGVPVLKDGEHTGAKPGRFVRGPGWRRKPEAQ